ncbi:hypothetical protein [Streptomyces sp. AK02-01A]|uniref:hypothetical protein n=1 Tax=Streptomyces sp. AK02-01A TaxID=3028648 RepID=UPI0029BF9EAF|nr:hypothetical protein [Streptomyces sp. AK02-01A]MDX3855633.1 hypothetical protein [Streptomyces sp. AK02-01A]
MATVNPGAGAALSVVLGAACGYVTNLVTGEWSWSLGAGLVLLVAAAAALAWWNHSQTAAAARRATVRQTATGRSVISGARITARGDSLITETAENQATIKDSTIETTRGAEVERKADDSRIENSHIVTD